MRSTTAFQSPSTVRHAIAAILAIGATALGATNIAYGAEVDESAPADTADMADITISADRARNAQNEPSAASFGFPMTPLETPRTMTFVSEEQLRLYGVASVDDLTRLVPGTYTTTRYGLQGGISVRGVSADFYYRGMRRLQMQGHVRTVLSAYDNIEVIKGPPSPLYGMGQIGGYANLDPKSSRAKNGKYDNDPSGYFQATHDTYNKNEAQFGLGVPFSVLDRAGGVYVVGLLEDSKTFIRNVPAKQKFLQATTSIDNAIGPLRLETGGQMQNSVTSGAYFNRATQELIDSGTYIRGRPLVNLDFNADGRVGYVETYLGSPVVGAISGNNQSLDQRFTLRNGADGNPLPLSSFADSIVGIPQSMKTYLTTGAGASLSCPLANYMRTTAPVMTPGTATAGALVTRQLPAGFVLDPCTTQKVSLNDGDYRANGSYEREQNATQQMGYLDLIYDTDPNFTVKNQLYFDSLSSFKDSWLPYGENQAIRAIEDKITATYKVPADWLPEWFEINSLASINRRQTTGYIKSSGGDWDYRQDVLYQTGAGGSGTAGHYANTMFWTQLTNPGYQTGVPDSSYRRSKYSETGVGIMLDLTVADKTSLLLGARGDKVKARVNESATFNPNTGTSVPTAALINNYILGLACAAPGGACPGAFLAPTADVEDSDSGVSYSASLSHELPWGRTRPYVTIAKSTITLDGANNLYARSTVTGGKLVGEAELKEVGIKGELFAGKAQWTISGFKQNRTDVSNSSDPSISAFATSTETKGIESSINFQPIKTLSMGASLTFMEPKYTTGLTTGQVIDVNARDLGFRDIVLPTGEIYPAEAFGYGGRLRVLVNDPNNIYNAVPGIPKWQASANATYAIGMGFGVLLNGQYVSKSWANRLQTEVLPNSTILNAGLTWDKERLHLKVNVYNLTDELTFRAGNGGNPNLLSVLPDRRYEFSLKLDF
jgi:outer membrane receptor protein involved in Fe transport